MAGKEHVLVTGGAGFIGSHLVERLLAEGRTVTVIDDCSTGRLENLQKVAADAGLRVIQEKVSQCRELAKLAGSASAIYHLAAAVGVELVVNSPIRVLETNLRETEVLLAAVAGTTAPVLLASTSEVYGKSQKAAFTEEDDLLIGPPHRSRWSYACSKLMDEFLALAHARERGLPVIITRLFNTVGARQTGRYGMVLPRFIAAARSGRTSARAWGRPANALFLSRQRHGGGARAVGALSGGTWRSVQRGRHGGDQHPGPGASGGGNVELQVSH